MVMAIKLLSCCPEIIAFIVLMDILNLCLIFKLHCPVVLKIKIQKIRPLNFDLQTAPWRSSVQGHLCDLYFVCSFLLDIRVFSISILFILQLKNLGFTIFCYILCIFMFPKDGTLVMLFSYLDYISECRSAE